MGRQPLGASGGSAGVGVGEKKLLAGPAAGLGSADGRSRSESTICPPFSTPRFTSSVILAGLMSTVTDCLPWGDGRLVIWYQPRYQPRPRNATVAAPTRA